MTAPDWQALSARAEDLLAACRGAGVTLATAESCTGGLIAGVLTEIAGSSDVFLAGFVTYSNPAKTQMLGIDAGLIKAQGAVSEAVARAMAEGAVARSGADLAVAVTGIAGPSGGSREKPVGLVHLASAGLAHPTRHLERRYGDLGRADIRLATVGDALAMLREAV